MGTENQKLKVQSADVPEQCDLRRDDALYKRGASVFARAVTAASDLFVGRMLTLGSRGLSKVPSHAPDRT